MVSRPLEHCPACGAALDSHEGRGVYRCPDCDALRFRNPAPNARVVVVDGAAALLVRIADEARLEDPPYDPEWMTPGGHVELDEQPREAAARELAEETALSVAPDALTHVDAVARQVVPDAYSLVLLYAVERSATTGEPRAATDAAAARFWTTAALEASNQQYRTVHDEPARYRTFEGLLGAARTALEAA